MKTHKARGEYSVILVQDEIRKRIKQVGSLRGFARTIGVSAAYVSDVMNDRREPGGKLLVPLGLRKFVVRDVSYDWKPQ